MESRSQRHGSLFTRRPPGPCRPFLKSLCSLRWAQPACLVPPLGGEDFEAPQGACVGNMVAPHAYSYSRVKLATLSQSSFECSRNPLSWYSVLPHTFWRRVSAAWRGSKLPTCWSFLGVSFREQVYVKTKTVFTFVYFVHNI